MSLQTSSMVDPSAPNRSELLSTPFKEVQIEPLTDYDHVVSRTGPARIAVRIREGIFHYQQP
jgi:hypothetical protein